MFRQFARSLDLFNSCYIPVHISFILIFLKATELTASKLFEQNIDWKTAQYWIMYCSDFSDDDKTKMAMQG